MSLNERGQSLIEVLIAVLFFGTVIFTVVVMFYDSTNYSDSSWQSNKSVYVAQKNIEIIKNISQMNWQSLNSGKYILDKKEGVWELNVIKNEDELEEIIIIEDVYRNVLGGIVDSEQGVLDRDTKRILVQVYWNYGLGEKTYIEFVRYLYNFDDYYES